MREILIPERWQKLEEIYCRALQLPHNERSAFLGQVCAGDEELRLEAESLLAADSEVGDDPLPNGLCTVDMEILADGEDNEDQKGDEVTTEPFNSTLTVGAVIDQRYQILSPLDAGGIGEVFKAKDFKFPDRPVAIKVLKRESHSHPWKFKKFREDEPDAQSRVQHPNVAMVFDKGTLRGGEPYLVVELVHGKNLGQLIREHKTEDEQINFHLIAEVMRQVCSGVSAIHRANLIHRDLTPKNIMLFETSETDDVAVRVKIIDFGIVRDLDKSTLLGQSVGTLPFMSPEQINGEDVTIASDIYSLGVIAYLMLTNNLPFNAKSYAQLHTMQMEGVKIKPSALRSGLPQTAEEVVLKALSYNPSDRPRTARDFGDELIRALTERKQAPTFDPEATTPTLSRFRARHFIAAGIVAVVLAFTLWIYLPLFLRPERELTYWLTVVRQGDGRTVHLTGREAFDTGDEFQFHFTPAQAGALYLFNEGPNGNWHVLFPTRHNNDGNPEVSAGQTVSTEGNVFTAKNGLEKGTERIWFVWAPQAIPALDEILKASLDTGLVVNVAEQQAFLRQFTTEHAAQVVEPILDKQDSSVKLKTHQVILVKALELEHANWK